MSVPRKMSEYAALFGCTIEERQTHEGNTFFACANGNEEIIGYWYNVSYVELNTLKELLQRVSGWTLAQYWTGR